MATIGDLIINMNANTAAIVTELRRVSNLSFDTAKQVQRSFSLIGTAALGMLSTAAAALAVGIEKTLEWEVHIGKLALAAGTTVETMSGLSYAAKIMGLDIDNIAQAMARLDKQLLQAALGNKRAGQNVALLGLDLSTIKTSDDALMQLSAHFSAMPTGMMKTAEASAAFGKSFQHMLALLNPGPAALKELITEAGRMGLIITQDQVNAAKVWEENMARMKESLHGLYVEITNAVIPAMNDLLQHFQDTKAQGGWLKATVEAIVALGPLVGGLQNEGAAIAYLTQGSISIAIAHDKLAKAVKDATLPVSDHQKAIDALAKTFDGMMTSLETQVAMFGKGAMAIQEYKLETDAAAIGERAWGIELAKTYRQQQQQLTMMQTLAPFFAKTLQDQYKRDMADKLALNMATSIELGKQLDLVQKLNAEQLSPAGPGEFKPEVSKEFQDAYDWQMNSLKYSIATWGRTRAEITRFNMAQADGGPIAKAMTEQIIAQQDKLQHLQVVTATWGEFTRVADRSLNDLIFSGKKFTQVLADVTKQLGELLLKMALFGAPGSSGGGLFGSLFKGIFGGLTGGLFGGGAPTASFGDFSALAFAGGGAVDANVPILVGENGPEIFRPSTAGAIIPNGGGAGGGPTIIYQIDARGSSITEAQFQRSLQLFENRAVQRALQAGQEIQLRTA
ncbi:MAG TPA: hypothetical protein VGR34_00800 [Candidatus Dormibacteraeota bacterium]|nr:hypothetical protein [Candidatus Dormibacteraeota bacterium]